jgi:hypothetical protein
VPSTTWKPPTKPTKRAPLPSSYHGVCRSNIKDLGRFADDNQWEAAWEPLTCRFVSHTGNPADPEAVD